MLDMKNVPVFNYTYPQAHYKVGEVFSFWTHNYSYSVMESAKPEDIENYAQALEVDEEIAPVNENGKVFVIGVVVEHEIQGFSETPVIKVMFKYMDMGKTKYYYNKFITGTDEPGYAGSGVMNMTKLFPNPYLEEKAHEEKYTRNGKVGKVLATHLGSCF